MLVYYLLGVAKSNNWFWLRIKTGLNQMHLNQFDPFHVIKNLDSLSKNFYILWIYPYIFFCIYLITWVVYIPVSAFQKIRPLLVLLEMATPDLLGYASFVPTYFLYNTYSTFLSFSWACKKCDTWLLSHFKFLASLFRPKY